MNGLLSALTSTKTNNDTTYGDQIGSSRLKKYNNQAKDLFDTHDVDRDRYLSAKEAKKCPYLKGKTSVRKCLIGYLQV